jgi:hypothetical protein
MGMQQGKQANVGINKWPNSRKRERIVGLHIEFVCIQHCTISKNLILVRARVCGLFMRI